MANDLPVTARAPAPPPSWLPSAGRSCNSRGAVQWRAHGHYLARERATEKREKKAAGFSRSQRSVDIAQRLDEWQKAGDDGSSKSSSRPSSETGSTLRITRGKRWLRWREIFRPSGNGSQASITTSNTPI